MIKLSYKNLDGPFYSALQELCNSDIRMPAKTAYTISKIRDKVDTVMREAREGHGKILKPYVYLDDKGEVKHFPPEVAKTPDGEPMIGKAGEPLMTHGEAFRFQSDIHQKEYLTDLEKYLETPVELPFNKVGISEFGSAEMSPQMLAALEPIISPVGRT